VTHMPIDADVLRKRIDEIRYSVKELQRIASKEFIELDVDKRYAVRYNIIVLVESLAALCLHVGVEGFGVRPTSYKQAVRVVAERLVAGCVGELESLVGLRNLLIHRYWDVEDEKIYQSLKANFKCVEELLAKVEEVFLG